MELLVVIIVLALLFDYINGFHDAANSIATNWWFRYRQHGFQDGRGRVHHLAHHPRGGYRRYYLESFYLVERHPFLLLSYLDRRIRRGGDHGAWLRGDPGQHHPEDSGVHFPGAVDWYGDRLWVHVGGALRLPAGASAYRRGLVQEVAAALFRPVQYRSWPERLSEGDGYHRRGPHRRALQRLGDGNQQHQRPAGLGGVLLFHRDLARNDVRRMENREDDGNAHHEGHASGGGCRGDGRRFHALFDGIPENTGEYDAHHHGCDHWRGGDQTSFRRSLGGDPKLDDRLDPDDSGERPPGGGGLLRRFPILALGSLA